MQEFAFDGHDGAAKTPILEGVAAQLSSCGLRVSTFAPFHAANAFIGSEVYPMWEQDDSAFALLAILRSLIFWARNEAEETSADVLLFDRHWMTILGEIHGRHRFRHEWYDFIPLFFIQAPPSKTKACDRFSYAFGWTSSDAMVKYYYQRYFEIARRHHQFLLGQYEVVDKRQPLEPIITSVTGVILDRLRRG